MRKLLYEAFGESKYLRAWVLDPRAVIKNLSTVYTRINSMKWSVQKALTEPLKRSSSELKVGMHVGSWEIKAIYGNTALVKCECGSSRAVKVSHLKRGESKSCGCQTWNTLRIFGEDKTRSQWAEDPRCVVSYNTLCSRLRVGIDPEDAISLSPKKLQEKRRAVRAFGESKTRNQWAEDPRCVATYYTLCHRLRRGIDPEDAISLSPKKLQEKRTTSKEAPTLFGKKEEVPLETIPVDPKPADSEAPTVTFYLKKNGEVKEVYVTGNVKIKHVYLEDKKGIKIF